MKKFFWPVFCAAVLFVLYRSTGAQITTLLIPEFLFASFLFILSIFCWGFAWIYLTDEKPWQLFKTNIKSLAGILGPFGLGSDALRAYFSRKQGIPPEKALSTSFIVKFFKFMLIFLFLLISVFILSVKSNADEAFAVFAVSLAMAALGMASIWFMRSERAAKFGYRLLGRLFIFKFQGHLDKQFAKLSPNKIFIVLFFLVVSTLLEIASIMYAFSSVGQLLPLDRIIVFAAIANSLAFLTFTPQGVGFVEGGGLVVLHAGFFSLGTPVIGSFLIVWNIIRIWIPSLIGAIASAMDW